VSALVWAPRAAGHSNRESQGNVCSPLDAGGEVGVFGTVPGCHDRS
jgi:hypothetical protein